MLLFPAPYHYTIYKYTDTYTLFATMLPEPQIRGTKSTPAMFQTDRSGPSDTIEMT